MAKVAEYTVPSYVDPTLIRDLEWFLGVGMTKCARSTTGSVLERAKNACVDSEGNRIPRVDDPWKFAMPAKEFKEASYEMEFRDLFRIGRISRILNRVALRAPLSARVLGALYGDAGARWGRSEHGREASIFHLTESGQKLIASIRRRYPTSLEIRDDEVIAQDWLDQRRAPNDIRARQHRRIRDEADVLKTKAHKILVEESR